LTRKIEIELFVYHFSSVWMYEGVFVECINAAKDPFLIEVVPMNSSKFDAGEDGFMLTYRLSFLTITVTFPLSSTHTM